MKILRNFFTIEFIGFALFILLFSYRSVFADSLCEQAAKINKMAESELKRDKSNSLKYMIKAYNLCKDNADITYNLGYAYYFNENIDSALKYMQEALSKSKDNPKYLNNIAYIMAEDNRLSDAKIYAKRAYESDKNSPDVLHTYAFVLYRLNQYTDALDIIEKGNSSDSNIASLKTKIVNELLSDTTRNFSSSSNEDKGKILARLDNYKSLYPNIENFKTSYDKYMNAYLSGDVVIEEGSRKHYDEELNISSLNQIDAIKNDSAYALIIGISKYRSSLNPPQFARRDAENFKELMTRTGILKNDGGHIKQIYDGNATNTELDNGLQWLCKKGNLNKNSLLILYFSGHGSPKTDEDDMTIVDGYLIPSDISTDNITDRTALLLSYVKTEINKVKDSNSVIVLDACFSGLGKSVSNKKLPVVKIRESIIKSDNPIISAAAENKPADEYPSGKQGLFTYFFLEALMGKGDNRNEITVANGDGWVDTYEAFSYAKYKIERLGKEQNPQMSCNSRIKLTRVP
ncbi:MAG: caspase family protein [Desulfobacterales bacterium]|nr:caspase family protein [Desulfobacterales bacterium]